MRQTDMISCINVIYQASPLSTFFQYPYSADYDMCRVLVTARLVNVYFYIC